MLLDHQQHCHSFHFRSILEPYSRGFHDDGPLIPDDVVLCGGGGGGGGVVHTSQCPSDLGFLFFILGGSFGTTP